MSDDRQLNYKAHGSLTGQPPDPDMMPHDHTAGCVYGGFSCRYWLIADGCPEEHWEIHYCIGDERCPCGTWYPDAPIGRIIFNATAHE